MLISFIICLFFFLYFIIAFKGPISDLFSHLFFFLIGAPPINYAPKFLCSLREWNEPLGGVSWGVLGRGIVASIGVRAVVK